MSFLASAPWNLSDLGGSRHAEDYCDVFTWVAKQPNAPDFDVCRRICDELGFDTKAHFDSFKKKLSLKGDFGPLQVVSIFAKFFSEEGAENEEIAMFQSNLGYDVSDTAIYEYICTHLLRSGLEESKLPMVAYLLVMHGDKGQIALLSKLNEELDETLGSYRFDFPPEQDKAELLIRLGASLYAKVNFLVDAGRNERESYTVSERFSQVNMDYRFGDRENDAGLMRKYEMFTQLYKDVEEYYVKFQLSTLTELIESHRPWVLSPNFSDYTQDQVERYGLFDIRDYELTDTYCNFYDAYFSIISNIDKHLIDTVDGLSPEFNDEKHMIRLYKDADIDGKCAEATRVLGDQLALRVAIAAAQDNLL